MYCRFLRLSTIQDDRMVVSSSHRHARANQFPNPKNRHDLLELLSDTEDPVHPFFREGSAKDIGKTVALG